MSMSVSDYRRQVSPLALPGDREWVLIISCPTCLDSTFRPFDNLRNAKDGRCIRYCPINYQPSAIGAAGYFFSSQWKKNWIYSTTHALTTAILPTRSGQQKVYVVAIEDGDPSHIFCREEQGIVKDLVDSLLPSAQAYGADFQYMLISPQDLMDYLTYKTPTIKPLGGKLLASTAGMAAGVPGAPRGLPQIPGRQQGAGGQQPLTLRQLCFLPYTMGQGNRRGPPFG